MENPSTMKQFVLLFILIAVLLPSSGCVSLLRYDGPYEGRVIDAESGLPIEGAVTHGTWSIIHPTPAGRSTEYFDSYETLTDKDGNFKIPGKGLLIFSNIDDMSLTIFKAGYEQRRPSNWSGLVQFGSPAKVTWDEAGKGTFMLRKLSMEERKNRGIVSPGTNVPAKNQRLFRVEYNKEQIEIGSHQDSLYTVE